MPYAPGDILLDKYRIEALLGQGAFGDVYRVTYLPLNQLRALKVLRRDTPGLGSKEFSDAQQRFLLEAQLGAQLNSPNPNPHLLMIYEPISNDDLAGLVMEYAPGKDLSTRIRQARESGTPIPIEAALNVAIEVAQGLSALHAIDIIHRDLKPANILFDQNGRARLSDLGLVQSPEDPSYRSQLSNPNQHPGTPGYMSPEQESTRNLLKPPSDIYALGLVLFEMLTGRKYALLEPGTHANTIRKEIPPTVDDLLATMLAESYKDRPWDGQKTAVLLDAALQKIQNEQREELARLEASKKAEAAEQARLAQIDEEQRKEAQRKAQAEAAERALQTERLARESAFQAPAAKPAGSRFSLAGLAALGLVGLAAVVFVFVIFSIYWSMVGGTPISPAPTTAAIAVVTEQPGAAPPVPTNTPTQSPTLSPTRIPTNLPVLAITREKDGMVMVYVPAGPFTMGSDSGSDDEKPMHTVTLDAFWIDQTEVTNAMFQSFVQSSGYQTDAEKAGKSYAYNPTSNNWQETAGANFQHPQGPNSSLSGLSTHPVVHVSWNDASAYCVWAGARLPVEAEWEKAARGEDGRTYPWGETAPNGKLLNFADINLAVDWADKNTNDGYQFTAPVGSYPTGASPYGALDMAGNVWEWVEDWYDAYPGNSVGNTDFGTKYRVLRGGSWNFSENVFHSALRFRNKPTDADFNTGFRCSRSQ